jgi:hypothetical protein
MLRSHPLQKKPIDLRAVVNESVALIAHDIKARNIVVNVVASSTVISPSSMSKVAVISFDSRPRSVTALTARCHSPFGSSSSTYEVGWGEPMSIRFTNGRSDSRGVQVWKGKVYLATTGPE